MRMLWRQLIHSRNAADCLRLLHLCLAAPPEKNDIFCGWQRERTKRPLQHAKHEKRRKAPNLAQSGVDMFPVSGNSKLNTFIFLYNYSI